MDVYYNQKDQVVLPPEQHWKKVTELPHFMVTISRDSLTRWMFILKAKKLLQI